MQFMKARKESSILIVGAGPVGLTLAIDLALRGVEVTVVEKRYPREVPTVRCNHISARSMEIFRRLGLASALRNTGLPEDFPNDASFRTTVVGQELSRIHIPCRRERYSDKSGPDGWWPTPEPPHRINQQFIEPILFDRASQLENITLINRAEVTGFYQDFDRVTAVVHHLDSDETTQHLCDYLVGCDGGRSTIRKGMGSKFVGDAVIQRVQSTYIRAPRLIEKMQADRAWAIVSLNPRRSGTLYAIDGKEHWLVHNYLKEDEADFEAIDREWAIRTILGVDDAFEIEMLHKEDWFGRRLVAERFRNGRVFICGDSAHIWVPYGGYGMNAGIADAANLAWLLAAVVNGWGASAILNAYERERLPITEQVSHFAMNYAHHMIKNRRAVPQNMEENSAEGEAVRAEFGQMLYDLNVQQYCCAGLNFGYFYDDSPLIVYDEEAHPAYSMAEYTPATVSGCRLPHFWLNGRSLYDHLGNNYTLLRFDNQIDVSSIVNAAEDRDMPLTVVDIPQEKAPSVFQHKLLLSRPDQHIAWRGNKVWAEPNILIEKVCGGIFP